MKKIILIAAAALMSFAAKAQEVKFAYVNFEELVMLSPDMDVARTALEENAKMNEAEFMNMYKEYETKLQEYELKSATWSEGIVELKQREIMQMQEGLKQAQQQFQLDLQQLQQKLQAPIIEAARTAVNELAKAKGVAAVFDTSNSADGSQTFLYLDPEQLMDLTPEARVMLNIPEDRTLESLYAEMQAAAQTAQR